MYNRPHQETKKWKKISRRLGKQKGKANKVVYGTYSRRKVEYAERYPNNLNSTTILHKKRMGEKELRTTNNYQAKKKDCTTARPTRCPQTYVIYAGGNTILAGSWVQRLLLPALAPKKNTNQKAQSELFVSRYWPFYTSESESEPEEQIRRRGHYELRVRQDGPSMPRLGRGRSRELAIPIAVPLKRGRRGRRQRRMRYRRAGGRGPVHGRQPVDIRRDLAEGRELVLVLVWWWLLLLRLRLITMLLQVEHGWIR